MMSNDLNDAPDALIDGIAEATEPLPAGPTAPTAPVESGVSISTLIERIVNAQLRRPHSEWFQRHLRQALRSEEIREHFERIAGPMINAAIKSHLARRGFAELVSQEVARVLANTK